MQLPAGYRLRPPVIEDGPAIADMLNTETVALTGVPLASVEWVTTAWTAPGARLDRDFGVITDGEGTIAGYFMIQFEPPFTTVFGIGAVALPHHGRGVGSAIIEEIGRRGREIAVGRENVTHRMGVLAGEPRVAELLTAHGFHEARVFWSMTLRFDGPPPPPADIAGIDVRTLVPGQERQVYECAADASRITGATDSRPRTRGCIATSTPVTASIPICGSWPGSANGWWACCCPRPTPRRIPSSGTSACWGCAARPAAAASARRCCVAAS
jgi:GNAT superfamily N-acetyltransferase